MLSSIRYIILLAQVSFLFPIIGNSQTLFPTNSTPTGYGATPIGWSALIASPDVSNNYGWMGVTTWYLPVDNPPNGHTLWVTGYSTEKSGTIISDLMLGVTYTLNFYMAELETSLYDASTDGTLQVELGDETYFFPFSGGLDFSWSLQTITFVATAPNMALSFKYQEPLSHKWNISVDGILEFACDTLDSYVSETKICFGEEITLSATSLNGGTITWDGDVVNGESFTPPAGTLLYTASSDLEGDCVSMIEVIVYEYPDFDFVIADTEICEGDSVIIGIDGSGGVYDWEPDIVVGYPYFPDVGITDVVLSVINGICETVDTLVITVHEKPAVTALVDDSTICLGESVIFTGEGAHLYNWDFGIVDGEPFTPESVGTATYFVEGLDTITGCSANNSVNLTVFELPTVVATATDTEVCEGYLTTLAGSGAASFEWDLGVTDGVAFEPPFGTTTYTVNGTNENGCQNTASITINVIDCDPVFAGFVLPNSICQNDCISLKDITIGDVVTWDWNFGSAFEPNTSNVQNPTICANTPGVYTITLTAKTELGASSTHTEEIIVYENPILEASLDTIIDAGGRVDLTAKSVSSGDISWTPTDYVDCDECPITTASLNQNQTFTVQLIDLNGCKAIDSVVVWVNFNFNIGVPTAFSPNNDGNNDILYVKGEGFESIYFSIYNRYGELIFESTDQQIGWDGTFLNKAQNPGVFTWVLFYTTQDVKNGRINGNTTLVR